MFKYSLKTIMPVSLIAFIILTGCVERKLTINTKPQGALVVLNDEEIGESPVTTNFNWYGDYCIRINKKGYETLKTHQKLNAPWYDHFPFDFFTQVVYPGRIVDSYEWQFELSPRQEVNVEELIKQAREMQKQLE